MRFRFVAKNNGAALRLWKKLGAEVVDRLPQAFDHPSSGYRHALVMYQWLIE